MTTERQVAQDAVRTAYGDPLANHLEQADAAIRHLNTIVAALRAYSCQCGVSRPSLAHARLCPVADALRVLDPRWEAEELERAWIAAQAMNRLFNLRRGEQLVLRSASLRNEGLRTPSPSSSLVELLEIDSLERVNALLGQVQAEELDRETAPEEEATASEEEAP